jgi:hypothetical protein
MTQEREARIRNAIKVPESLIRPLERSLSRDRPQCNIC